MCRRQLLTPTDDLFYIDPDNELPQPPLDSIDPQLEDLSCLRNHTTAQAAPLFHHLTPTQQDLGSIEDGNVYLQGCQGGTQVSRLPRWTADLRHAVLLSIGATRIHTIADVTTALACARVAHHASTVFTFAKIEPRMHTDHDVPQLHYNQLTHIHQVLVSDTPILTRFWFRTHQFRWYCLQPIRQC